MTTLNTPTTLINTLSYFKNPDATIPTAIIEACCTSGRTYQSYKRGGTLEAKERFREEATCGFFWLFGVKGFNKIGDFIGKKIFKLEYLDTDVGKDALRNPFYNVAQDVKNKTAFFKFGKIFASVVLATGLLGFVVPIVNHAITQRALKERNEKENKSQNAQFTLDEFMQNITNTSKEQSFKGSGGLMEGIMKLSYNLENNNIARLISTDAGMIAGRVANSRHPAEAFEYLFRDLCSIYFYNFATYNIVSFLNKICNKTNIHPKAIEKTCEFLKGVNMTGNEVLNSLNAKPDKLFEQFTDKETYLLDEFVNKLRTLGVNNSELENKAARMSTLQPLFEGKSILSKAQLKDVFTDSISANNPEFLRDAINEATYGRALDETKFVSAKECQKIRETLDSFIKEIAKKAGDGKISDYVKNTPIAKGAYGKTALFHLAGMAVSAFGLAILIPKLQIYLSQKRYGKKSFEDIAQGNKNDGKVPS